MAPAQAPDVVVVGGGPSGSACAFWLAQAGYDVTVVERKHYPREKTCGDALTPRAVRQLEDMGLGAWLATKHRYAGLRSVAFGRSLELEWPQHPEFPPYGYVISRSELDQRLAGAAAEAGATVLEGIEATAPLAGSGGSIGVSVRGAGGGGADAGASPMGAADQSEVRASYLVVADGANSRIGRALGARRDRAMPLGMAIRGYYTSSRHEEQVIESHLDLDDAGSDDASGESLPGYGWIFPMGDGRVNVGVGLLSTSSRWKSVNTTNLLARFVESAPPSWGLTTGSACSEPTGGKLPMALSVGPAYGRRYLLIGDAAGSINPFNGEGIAYALETGRLAAFTVARALASSNPEVLSEYPAALERRYGDYYRSGVGFVRMIGHPMVMRTFVEAGMRSQPTMELLLRLMSNLLRPEERRVAEWGFAGVSRAMSLRRDATEALTA